MCKCPKEAAKQFWSSLSCSFQYQFLCVDMRNPFRHFPPKIFAPTRRVYFDNSATSSPQTGSNRSHHRRPPGEIGICTVRVGGGGHISIIPWGNRIRCRWAAIYLPSFLFFLVHFLCVTVNKESEGEWNGRKERTTLRIEAYPFGFKDNAQPEQRWVRYTLCKKD